MADYRMFSKNKNYINHKSMNGLLLLTYLMVLIFAPYNSAQLTESNNTSCNEFTCTKCTIKDQCAWSLDQQACVRKTNDSNNSSLMVFSENNCPHFSVQTIHEYNSTFNSLVYIVKVSNNLYFVKFLNENNFTCNSSTIDIYKSEIKNDEIQCSTQIANSYFMNSTQSLTAFIYVKFNGVILLLDNVTDYYATIYKHPCAEEDKDKYCATCTWNDDVFSHYVRLCSTKNSCEGHNELYMSHNSIGQFQNLTSQRVKDRCAEINVTAINPLSVSQAAGSNITITVKNHEIFKENRTVSVTVAGEVCADPKTTENDTITCITSPPPNDTYVAPSSGPVLVTYTSNNGQLNIESSQTFQIQVGTTCGAPPPVLVLRQELRGVELGGTTVTLNGFRFMQPCSASPARMFVKLPNGTMHFASKHCDKPVNDTSMVCRAPEMNITNGFDVRAPNFTRALNFGLEVMNSALNESLLVDGPSISYYHVLKNYELEEFEIVKGDSVAIYGKNLLYIHSDILIQFNDSLVKKCEVTSVEESSFICKPNTTFTTSAVMIVKIGGSLTYNVKIIKSKFIFFFMIILFTVIVLNLACLYLFNRRSKVNKKVEDYHPVNLVDLDPQTKRL